MGFRLFWCAVIVSCGCFFGLELRRRLYIRLRSLEMFRGYFRTVRAYISHFGMSLCAIADEIDKGGNTSKFSLILREKLQHSDFPAAFSNTLDEVKNSLSLYDDDVALLVSIANRMGGLDLDSAVSSLNLADEQLSSVIDSAKDKCETDGKIYAVLGLSCGIAVALLLL